MTDDNGTARSRVLEAVAISVLTAIGTALVDAVTERLKKRRKRKRKPRRAEPVAEDDGAVVDALYVGAPWHVYPEGEGHDTDSTTCWCKPDVQEGGRLIIHRQPVS